MRNIAFLVGHGKSKSGGKDYFAIIRETGCTAVQVGAYSQRANAEAMAEKLKAAGFGDVLIKSE